MKINQVVNESPQLCPECGGLAFSDLMLAEKKDACYSKVRSRYKVWPSAYASGALVQCRKKGAANWGNKSKNEDVVEGLADEFAAMARARGMNVRRAGTPDEERARTQQKLAQRAAERETADKEAAEQDFAKLPELKAEYQQLQAKYDALGGNRWQYADREQNLTDSERKARSIESKLNQLAGRIARAEKSQGVAEGKQPGKSVTDAIQKVMPSAQEIWFHGSRATGKHRRNSDTDILVVIPDDIVGDQYLAVVRTLQKLSSLFDNYDIQPTKSGTTIHRIAQEEGKLLWSIKQGVAEGLNEFAPGGGDSGDDGFSDETLKQLAAQWYNGDEDPRVERTLAAAGWEIGQDEGYDDEPGVFVVQSGDEHGRSYMSWPAHELRQGMAEDDVDEGVRVANQQIPGTKNRAKTAYYPTNVKPRVPKLNDPLTDQELARLTQLDKMKKGVAEGDISQLEKAVADAPVEPIANMESATDSDGYVLDREDAGEYDYEGDQAKDQLRTIVAAARKLDGILNDNENMPEWVQMKITKATDYLDTAADYVAANKAQAEPMAEGHKKEPPEADYGPDYQDMVARVKKLAGLGPLKTVWDPQKRVYKNVPTAVQPRDKK